MTVFTLAGFQYYGAALEGTPRRPPALGISASCTPTQSTAVSHRRGRISSGSPETREADLCTDWDNSSKPRPLLIAASCTQAQTSSEVHRPGWGSPGSHLTE